MENTELIVKITEVDQRSKSNQHRLEKIEENQKILVEMNTNIRLMAEQNKVQNEKIDTISSDMSEIKGKVNEIENKDAKDAKVFVQSLKDKLMGIAVTVVGTAIITAIFTLIITNLK